MNRTVEGDEGEGGGGGCSTCGDDDDDDERDGVGGRPWRTLGEELEAEDLHKLEETLGENIGEFKIATEQDMFVV